MNTAVHRAARRTERLRRIVLQPGTDDVTEVRRLVAARRLARRRTPAAIRVLAGLLAAEYLDRDVRRVARRAVDRARGQAAIDAVCDALIETGDGDLAYLVGRHGWLPSDPARRALMLFITRDLDRYAEADPDGSLLAAGRMAADERTRALLACRAVRDGSRAQWSRAVWRVGARLPPDLSEVEWQALIGSLAEGGHVEDLAQLAGQAPAVWVARLLDRLPRSQLDRAGFAELAPLARAAVDASMTDRAFEQSAELERPHSKALIKEAALAGSELLAVAGYQGEVWLSHLPSGTLTCVLKPPEPGTKSDPLAMPYGQRVETLVATSDGTLLAAGCGDGTIRLWHLPSGAPAGVLRGHTGGVDRLSVTSDGTLLVSGCTLTGYGQRPDVRVRLWRLPSKAPAAKLGGHGMFQPRVLAISPDGRWLVTSRGERLHSRSREPRGELLRLWHLPSGKPAGTLRCGVTAVAFTPDSQRLLTFDPPRMWNLPDLAPQGALPDLGTGDFQSLSSDGRRMAALVGNRFRVSRFPSGAEIGVLENPGESRSWDRCGFTPDGRLLVATGSTTWIWRPPYPAATGVEMTYSHVLTTVHDAFLVGKQHDGLRLMRYRSCDVVGIADKPAAEITSRDLDTLRRARDDPAHADSGERALAAFILALAHRCSPGAATL